MARPITHGGNRHVDPSRWGMKLQQFTEFLALCQKDYISKEGTWNRCWEETQRKGVVQEAGYVDAHQVCEAYVKPWTRGTGSSVALRFNPQKPLQAQVMVSHTWSEDIIEVKEAICDRVRRSCPEGDHEELVIWFCLFAIYQPGDEEGDLGPTVAEQMRRNPFESVIRQQGLQFLCLAITSRQDPYERLWSVYELKVALDVMEERRLDAIEFFDDFVVTEYSEQARKDCKRKMRAWCKQEAEKKGLTFAEWEQEQPHGAEFTYHRASIDCRKARCSKPEDEDMICNRIEEAGGWDRLDEQIANFRRPHGIRRARGWRLLSALL